MARGYTREELDAIVVKWSKYFDKIVHSFSQEEIEKLSLEMDKKNSDLPLRRLLKPIKRIP